VNRFLHISFTFNEGLPKVQELEPLFNALSADWMRYSFNCWIVWTARPANDYLYALRAAIGQSDSVMIVKLDLSDRTGWQPKWIWDWMDRKRELGPPPPPAPPSADLWGLLAESGVQNPFSPQDTGGVLGPAASWLLNPPDKKPK
jgi:hypothetical protein